MQTEIIDLGYKGFRLTVKGEASGDWYCWFRDQAISKIKSLKGTSAIELSNKGFILHLSEETQRLKKGRKQTKRKFSEKSANGAPK